MQFRFKRVAIVNRGEPAMRLIHAVRELNSQYGCGLRTIALFTEPDRRSMFVREADESYCLGPASWIDPSDNSSKSRYLDMAGLQLALRETKAEAVWVGWGFVAERAEFADLCASMGLAFVGPDGDVMRLLGDKIASKKLAEKAQVPVAAWSGGAVDTLEDALEHARRLSYPVLIKATAGGGGRGIRKVGSDEALSAAFEGARSEALKAFGDGTVFIEKLVPDARHVEVQVLGDKFGNTWAVGVRDCTIQRKNQKVLEEAPSPVLPPAVEQAFKDAAVRLAREAGYHNAGTAEFLYNAQAESFFFMEMNTRLQVEHPVTEATTGIDLVKCQLLVADGQELSGGPPPTQGHAIEVRLNAEDPDNGFAPSPGQISLLRLPTGPGLRVDTGVAQGDSVPPDFDSMIAKVIAWGKNREEALSRLRCALSEMVVIIEGGRSNKAFLLELLDHPDVRQSRLDIGWLDRTWGQGATPTRPHADVALLQTAIELYERAFEVEKQAFLGSAARGRVEVRREAGLTAELGHSGQTYRFSVFCVGPARYRLEVDGVRFDVVVEHQSDFERRLWCFGHSFRTTISQQGADFLVEVSGILHRISCDQSGKVSAPSPAVVLEVQVRPGDQVEAGQGLLLVEAMKMETLITAPFSGRVKEVMVTTGIHVVAGSPLLLLEPLGGGGEVATGERVTFRTASTGRRPQWASFSDYTRLGHQTLTELKFLVMGYEVPSAEVKGLLERWLDPQEVNVDEARGRGLHVTPWHILLGLPRSSVTPPPDEARQAALTHMLARDEEVLGIFADIVDLFERRPHSSLEEGPSRRECLLTFLRSFDPEDPSLPRPFLDKLERVVAMYGITTGLKKTPQLVEAMLWLHKAYALIDRRVSLAMRLLEARIESADAMGGFASPALKQLLDRLIDAAQDHFPALNELARLLHYRHFEALRLERSQARVYEIMATRLAQIATVDDPTQRDLEMAALANQPQPLGQFLIRRLLSSDEQMRTLFFEILVRRMYRIKRLLAVRAAMSRSHRLEVAWFVQSDQAWCVVGLDVGRKGLTDALKAADAFLLAEREKLPALADDEVSSHVATLAIDHVVIRWPADDLRDDAVLEELTRSVTAAALKSRPVRIAFSLVTGAEQQIKHHYTFVPAADGSYHEETRFRGIQPALADRLELWRLENFDIKRLRSAEDCYLFFGKSRTNPTDQRLFALVEVQDIIPFRDEYGRVVRVPHLERRTQQALDAMRDYLYRHPELRLDWNRLTLFISPPLEMGLDELEGFLQEIAPRLAVLTTNLGVERVAVHAWILEPKTACRIDKVMHITLRQGRILRLRVSDPGHFPISSLTPYAKNVLTMRRRGMTYPYEIVRMMTPNLGGSLALFPEGIFVEHDLEKSGELVPVSRPYGENKANVVVGVITNYTAKYPDGMKRVMILGDPSKGMGSLAEPECRRIIRALDLAEQLKVPVEWFAVSSGAKIAMNSGTENLDWTAAVLRRIIEFTQSGQEINIIVDGVNVGAQSYWNAEATMLMHTKGILIMTENGSMVLTGKRALEYSGSVSAEDHQGIGGVERIMGPNGQAQYMARDIADACQILFLHYYYTYVAPGERFPRPALTVDPTERDVTSFALETGHRGDPSFKTVGDIFSPERNPGRKKPFPVRAVLRSVVDNECEPLERWALFRSAESGVVWDAQIGGYPVCLIGIESCNMVRLGYVPADGPENWSGGTLFPLSSKKVARAINAASGNRPVVVLANLSGFDGSPESMRRLQLEYGAEIGRSVVNFQGPIVFCVISRYHGGAYVVFSRTLNENLEVVALEGSYASVIGGAPAAAVVFPKDVETKALSDPRIKTLKDRIDESPESERMRLSAEFTELYAAVYAEKLSEVADNFEKIHSVERAKQVGSLHDIIHPSRLRPYLVEALERGMKRVQG